MWGGGVEGPRVQGSKGLSQGGSRDWKTPTKSRKLLAEVGFDGDNVWGGGQQNQV